MQKNPFFYFIISGTFLVASCTATPDSKIQNDSAGTSNTVEQKQQVYGTIRPAKDYIENSTDDALVIVNEEGVGTPVSPGGSFSGEQDFTGLAANYACYELTTGEHAIYFDYCQKNQGNQ